MNKELEIKLSVQSWNIIIHALAQRPYIEVADLIAELKNKGDQAFFAETSEQSVEQNKAG